MKYRFVAAKPKEQKRLRRFLAVEHLTRATGPDMGLLLSVFGLLVFGWVMVYSSSALFAESRYHDQFYFLKRQVLWSLIGMLVFILASNIPMSFLQSNVKIFYVLTAVSLVLVLLIGPRISGARRWIRLPGISFQPSEVAKVVMVLVVSDYLDRRQSRLKDFKKGLLPLLGVVGVLVGLIVMEPDLGTPVLMCGVIGCLLLLGGARWEHFILMGMGAIPLLVIAVLKVRYRLLRFFAYLNPWADARGKGYQLVQSLLAMGSGGFFGRGLGESKMKIATLPDCHTDFIFSIIGEELGLMGTLLCVGLFLFLCMRGLRIAKNAPTQFSRLVAAGISLTLGFQALINMGVASGMFPTKGMPLPFISFGGSSLVVTLFSVGLLASVARQPATPLAKAGQ